MNDLVEDVLALGDRARALMAQSTMEFRPLHELSRREQSVLELLLQGARVQQVAEELHISVHTVRNHRKAIFAKVGVHSQVELMARLSVHSGLG